jgi:5-formyltetrahydrofolate cyclo-ligase
MDKRELRSRLRKTRVEMTDRARRTAALHLEQLAVESGLLLRYRRIGFYLPFRGEMDLMPLLNRALWLGKPCYLPVVPARFQRLLRFSRLTERRTWYHNRFGIPEHWSPRQLRARQLDLLFIPLVGFDEAGYRLGLGGGFYDASLAYLTRRKAWRKPLLVGVGYEWQKVDKVPHDPWDMPLDAVLTDKRLRWFER